MPKRVVVTGMGAVTPIGLNVPEFKNSLSRGICGQDTIKSFDASEFPVKSACELKGFDGHKYRVHIMDPFIQYAVAATQEAVEMAGFTCAEHDPYRIGISVSTSKGGMYTVERFKERFHKNPSAILGARIYSNSVPNFAAQWIARRWGVKGPAKCYVAACATGTVAIAEGARLVAEGVVDYCIAGSSDASIVPLILAGYNNMKVLSHERIRPFDKNRSGFIPGEGSGIVFLESLESAEQRKVKIYGEVLGTQQGFNCSDAIHFSQEEGALSHTVKGLFSKTGLKPGDIDYVNLHGTGTVEGDLYETIEVKKAFGEFAKDISMSSTKSMTGHMLGASGAAEVVASLLAMEHGFIPPTAGLEEADKACGLDFTPLKAVEKTVNKAVSLSMGFGGQIAVIALGKV